MARNKRTKPRFVEMEALFEGMQDLLTDEHGNPLTPDHPHYQKLHGLMEHMAEAMEGQDSDSSEGQPKGQA